MKIIAGVDEVGRGSLIGPVYASAVILKKSINQKLLKDSKSLSKKDREYLCTYIKKNSTWSIGCLLYTSLKSVIKGDKKVPSISAASIIAKVSRDKFITALSKKNKGYDWDKNFGYGTKQHLKALKKLGITKHHRKTFSPISKIN